MTAPKVILYYIFVKPSKPHLGKYNVMQKSTYILFVPLLIIQAITGFALLTQTLPVLGLSARQLILGWTIAPFIGGVAAAGAWARTIHYLINWLFIVLTTIHVYLSVTEDFPAFLDFFGMGGHHEHEEEHGHAVEPQPGIVPLPGTDAPIHGGITSAVATDAVPIQDHE